MTVQLEKRAGLKFSASDLETDTMQHLQICRNKVETEREVFLLCFVEKVNFCSNETPLGLQILIQNNLEVTLKIIKHREIRWEKNCRILGKKLQNFVSLEKWGPCDSKVMG